MKLKLSSTLFDVERGTVSTLVCVLRDEKV